MIRFVEQPTESYIQSLAKFELTKRLAKRMEGKTRISVVQSVVPKVRLTLPYYPIQSRDSFLSHFLERSFLAIQEGSLFKILFIYSFTIISWNIRKFMRTEQKLEVGCANPMKYEIFYRPFRNDGGTIFM